MWSTYATGREVLLYENGGQQAFAPYGASWNVMDSAREPVRRFIALFAAQSPTPFAMGCWQSIL
jgi:hypothetical protein